MWVQGESFHLNGHIIRFRPHTEKLELPYKTLSNTLAVKGFKKTCNRLRSKGKRQKRGEIAPPPPQKSRFHPVRLLLYASSSHGILAPAHFHESLVSGKPHGYIWFHIHEYSNDFLAIALSVSVSVWVFLFKLWECCYFVQPALMF